MPSPVDFRRREPQLQLDEGRRSQRLQHRRGLSRPRTPRAKPPDTQARAEKDNKAKDAKKDEKKPPPDETRVFVLVTRTIRRLRDENVVANQVLFVDAVRWLAGGEESSAGEVTTEEDVRNEHTKQKDLVWVYGSIFGARALVLGIGLRVWRMGEDDDGEQPGRER